MTIKIPKHLIFPVVTIAFIIGVLWFNSRGNKEGSASLITSQPRPTTQASPVSDQKVREIEVTAKQFEFSPNPIRVKLGETVQLNITSTDVTHGFSLPEFNIDEVLQPGKTASVTFQATRTGEFPFACSVACGVGHAGMRGKLIVE